MGNLSDRVMNMKFMRKTDADKEDINKEEQQKQNKDMSEWVLPNSAKLIAKNQSSNVIQSIGYASINSFSMGEKDEELDDSPMPMNVGRRTWGEPAPKKEPETELDVTRLKDSIPKKKGKTPKKTDVQSEEQSNEPEEKPELDTKDFLESFWKKNNMPTEKVSKKRNTDKKDDYVPDIKNKRKRFTNV